MCFQDLSTMGELTNYRTGLGTKFTFDEDCSQKETFYTTKKKKQIFKRNRKTVLVSHLIGKGYISLSKLCSVIGLAPSSSDVQFMKHMNFLRSITLELCLESMKSTRERAKC